MSRIGRRRLKKPSDDVDVDMVPIMNMFLVLIPFLLMSASFFQMKAINTSVPVQAENTSKNTSTGLAKAPKDIKVTVIVQIGQKGLDISAISDYAEYEELVKLNARIAKVDKGEYPLDQMAAYLQKIKEIYPSSDTIIIIPDGSVIYETIIQAMDTARYSGSGDIPLFPNVVLSGKVG